MTNKYLEEIRIFADEIMAAGLELQDTASELSQDLLDIAQMGQQYALRSQCHHDILAEAKARIDGGDDPAQVYTQQSDKLRQTWPDADGYGVAIVMLRKVVFGEEQS